MLINKLLSTAIRLWLKSQLASVDNLQISLGGKNQQILRGIISEVFISATHAIYQGLHLSEIEIIGNNINFDLAQVLKRKPLQLLEPIVINLEVLLQEKDLQNSLSSYLFSTALTDIWLRVLLLNHLKLPQNYQLYQWDNLLFLESAIFFTGIYNQHNSTTSSIGMKTNIKLNNAHSLLFSPTEIVTVPKVSITNINNLIIDLGKQVSLTHFELTSNYLLIKGTITVFPEIN